MMTETPALAKDKTIEQAAGRRLVSVDALRGFDMMWIIGGLGVGRDFLNLFKNDFAKSLELQLHHKDWEGFFFCDLIFPLFVFLVGISIVFSLSKIIAREGRKTAFKRIIKRSIVLYLLGIIYLGGMSEGWANMHFMGVLQRIALCYLFTAVIFCTFDLKGMIAICLALLIGYWALMMFVPVPEIGAGCFEKGRNLANYVDQLYLPGKKTEGGWDAEGLLSTLPGIAGCLMGVFAGLLLKKESISGMRKVGWLMAGGLVLCAAGWLWSPQFPVIKKIWTSSFILVSGGYSCLLMGVFYLIIDVWDYRRWAVPLVWIGMNPITIYMITKLVNFRRLAEYLIGGEIKNYLRPYDALAFNVVVLLLAFLLCRFLYQRKVFIRV